MKMVCIDFETANSFRGSICSVGIAIIHNGEVVETKSWLVKPHFDYAYFDPFNSWIHGIYEKDVKESPEFDVVYEQIKPLLKNAVLVAHNAAFDVSALRYALQLYSIPFPEVKYICTYKTATKIWAGLENHKLDTVCKHLKFDFKHHDATEDALACAKILISAMIEKRVEDVFELSDSIGMKVGELYDGGYNPCSIRKVSKKARTGTVSDSTFRTINNCIP